MGSIPIQHKLFSKDYIFLLSCVFFAAITHSLFISLFPIYILELGGNHALTGAMITGQVIAGTITRLVCGPLQDRFGRRKLLIAGAFLFALNIFAFVFTVSLPVIFFFRVLTGVSQGIYFGAAGTIVADITPSDRLVDGIGFFSVMGPLAASFSPAIGLYLFQHYSSAVMFSFASASALVAALFPLLIAKKYGEAVHLHHEEKQPKVKLALSSFLEFSILPPALVSFFILFANSSVTNFLAACGVERGLGSIGIFFTCNSTTMIIVRLLAGRVTRKTGEITMIWAGCVLLTASSLLIAFAHSTGPIIAAGILTGAGMGIVTPILNSLVFKFAEPRRKGVANSNYLLANDMGMGLGASFWGTTSQYSGYTVTYALSAVCVITSGFIHRFFLSPRIKLPVNHYPSSMH